MKTKSKDPKHKEWYWVVHKCNKYRMFDFPLQYDANIPSWHNDSIWVAMGDTIAWKHIKKPKWEV